MELLNTSSPIPYLFITLFILVTLFILMILPFYRLGKRPKQLPAPPIPKKPEQVSQTKDKLLSPNELLERLTKRKELIEVQLSVVKYKLQTCMYYKYSIKFINGLKAKQELLEVWIEEIDTHIQILKNQKEDDQTENSFPNKWDNI